jgi:hypothetical protein
MEFFTTKFDYFAPIIKIPIPPWFLRLLYRMLTFPPLQYIPIEDLPPSTSHRVITSEPYSSTTMHEYNFDAFFYPDNENLHSSTCRMPLRTMMQVLRQSSIFRPINWFSLSSRRFGHRSIPLEYSHRWANFRF